MPTLGDRTSTRTSKQTAIQTADAPQIDSSPLSSYVGSVSRCTFLSVVGVAGIAAVGALAGCGSSTQSSTDSQGSSSSVSTASTSASSDTAAEKTAITVAAVSNGYPTSFQEESGEAAGYEVDVVNAVAEKLADTYDFEFEFVDQTAVFAGLASGKYDQGLTNSFWTPERAEKYLQPEEAIGATILGLVVRSEDNDIRSLRDAAERGLSLAPITAGDGNYYVVEDYNEQNPDATLDLQATDDTNAFTEAFDWVAQGRYDLHVVPLQYYNGLVVEEGGTYHKYIDQLSFVIIGATKTWSFLTPNDTDYQTDWDAAVKELREEGKLAEFSRKWYSGINNWAFLTDDTQTYSYLDEAILVDPYDETPLTEYGDDTESAAAEAADSSDATDSASSAAGDNA